MTLRAIYNGIINFLSKLFNKIIDFDLTNLLIILGIILYVFYFISFIKKASNHVAKNFKKSNTIQKIGLVLGFVFLAFVLFMPFVVLVGVYR